MKKRNFLLGRGERLTSDITVRSGGGEKIPPYTVPEAKARLAPMLFKTLKKFDEIPENASPDGRVVANLTLNPEYIAKSHFPAGLLRKVGLEAVGSRPRRITPEKRSKGRKPEEVVTTTLFVSGTRAAFKAWADGINEWDEGSTAARELSSVEEIDAATPEDKIKGRLPDSGDVLFEIVLHADGSEGEIAILPLFREYLSAIGIQANFSLRFYAGGLCFLQVAAPVERARDIALYSAVRAVRQMPPLRMLRPTIRASSIPKTHVVLPKEEAMDVSISAAIFDGGVPDNHAITNWVTPYDATWGSPIISEYISHGVGVTSAFLFGHIDPSEPLPTPYCNVDHYRVLDDDSGQDPSELFEVLDRITSILSNKKYEFVNISLGPILAVEDDEVHAWTAVLDDLLSDGGTLATIAVGNTGESDAAAGLNRIQVPADCVNALAIGACDSPDSGWRRATYSSIGPGRSPGLMKPDFVAFGGALQRPFLVLGPNDPPDLLPIGGTSFAAPSVLRLGAGIRAHFGSSLNILAIRALLLHCTEPSDYHYREVGRGRCPSKLDDIVLCEDDSIRVVYQGSISPGKYIRAPIPLPEEILTGRVIVTATLCYITHVDPHHPGNYTRAGLETTFRPNSERFSRPEQLHPDGAQFFGKTQKAMTEEELRRDAWKWENTLHASVNFLGKSLVKPAFDIHYNSRMEGYNHNPRRKLDYALVISVKAKNEANLYDRVVRRFSHQLEPIKPIVDIPLKI